MTKKKDFDGTKSSLLKPLDTARRKISLESQILSRIQETLLAARDGDQLDSALAEEAELLGDLHRKSRAAIAQLHEALALACAATTNRVPARSEAEGEGTA